MSNFKSAWVTKSNANTKPWGTEISWSGAAVGAVKTITLKKGERTSFKINLIKDEMLICGSGKLKAYFADEELAKVGVGEVTIEDLVPGSALIVQSGCPYRLEALQDSIVLEISSQVQNSVVRLHDDYGRETGPLNNKITEIIQNLWGK